MNIIKEHGISNAIERYNMTKGAQIAKISDHAGEVITVKAFIIYEDEKADGTTSRVVSILTDDGDIMASAGYSRASFEDILECFGEDLPRLAIGFNKSRGGRTFYFFTPQE